VALPLVTPWIRNEVIERSELWLRLGAFLLPVLLLLFTSREQKLHLNFLFICGVLSLWYGVQFAALPDYPLPNADNLNYFDLFSLPVFLFILAAADLFQPLGLSFKPSLRGVGIVLAHLAIAAIVLIPLGLFTGLLKWNGVLPEPRDAALRLLTIYLFTALP